MIREPFTGKVIPVGKTAKKIEENFMIGETLPSWMSLSGENATYSISPLSSGYGYLQINTGSNSNNIATLNLFPTGIKMGDIKEIKIELDSLIFSGSESSIVFNLSIKNAANNKGIDLYVDNNDAKVVFLLTSPGNVKYSLPYDLIRNTEWKRRRNLFMILRADGTVAIGEGDNVFYENKFSPSELDTNDIMLPQLGIKTLSAVSQYMRISRIAVSIQHN